MSIWFMPWTYMLITLLVWGMGKGSAWYWCEITHRKLTPELTNFAIAFAAVWTALDFIMDGMKKYTARKTAAIEDTEKRKRAHDLLGYQLFGLLIVIVGSIGWLVLELMR